MKMKKKVAIVGAGLSGLACALELKKCGHDVVVFDKSERVGGRVKTDEVDGFLLDHGFQTYLTGYEKGQYYFDYRSLKLGAFSPGAMIFKDGRFSLFSDPMRRPKHLLHILLSPLATMRDKLLMLKLKMFARKREDFREYFQAFDMSTYDFLVSFGFSYQVIENFFKPFFAGVFLDPELKVDSRYFLYLFGKFSTSNATLPQKGMGALGEQLADGVGREFIRLSHDVTHVTDKTVTFSDGTSESFDHVVMATCEYEKNNILGAKSFEVAYHSVVTHYYKTKSSRFAKRYLYLNSTKSKVIGHVACLSSAQKSYAPKGWHLYSVNVVGSNEEGSCESQNVHSDLVKLFGEKEIEKWQWIKTFDVKHALNKNVAWGEQEQVENGIFLCGDYCESPSIQGALSSGFNLAHLINKTTS